MSLGHRGEPLGAYSVDYDRHVEALSNRLARVVVRGYGSAIVSPDECDRIFQISQSNG